MSNLSQVIIINYTHYLLLLATNVDSGSLSGAYPKTIADQEFNAVAAVVVAQLVERSLPTPEFCGSNPVIGKI